MMDHYPLMIPGAKLNSERIEVNSPYNNEPIATFEVCDLDTVELALANADALSKDRSRKLSVEKRIEILSKTADLMSEMIDVLTLEAAREGGKPLNDSQVEVVRAIDGVRSCIECLRTTSGEMIPMGINAASSNRIAFTHHEPIGTVVAVSAFNHPLNLIVHQVAPAIAAGNPVIVKPAEDTPISCYRFVSLLHQAGLEPIWCQALIVKDLAVASALVSDSRVAFFTFIGSAKVGWMLRSQLAAGTRCTLEHGGAAPVIIENDADLAKTVPPLVKGGYYHAGQVCVSVQRVFCHQSIIDDLIHRMIISINELKVGDPTLADTDIGPLIRTREVDRVHAWVSEAKESGAKILIGGNKISDSCYEPTLVLNPKMTAKVSTNEIFGPVVCLYSYDDLEQAIELANQLPFSFQASVFTQDIDRAIYISKQLNASAVMINDHTAFRVDWMPFAGLKQSGLGVGGIPYSFKEMQVDKLTVISSHYQSLLK